MSRSYGSHENCMKSSFCTAPIALKEDTILKSILEGVLYYCIRMESLSCHIILLSYRER